jgi:hypothetical protein
VKAARAVKVALRHPALQGIAGIAALLLLTWPLLAFDRPLYVFASFFVAWGLVILLLFAISRAPDEHPDVAEGHVSEAPDA